MDFDPNKNYYEILGVSEDSSIDDIKKAFKKAAVKHHPDRGGSKEEFQKVNEAYQVIGDPTKKQQYDMFRKGGFSGFGGGDGGFDFSGFQGGGGGFDFGGVDFGDLMGGIFGGSGFDFGGGGGRSRVRRGDDIKDTINISFEEGFLGVDKKIAYYRYVQAQGVESKQCDVCKGKGKVTKQARTPFGVIQTQSVCDRCSGTGNIYTKNGKELDNGGLERVKETLDIKIPAGIKDGAYIKFSGKGNAGFSGAETGDLYIQIRVNPSKVFERRGDNLYVKIDVSIFDLVLGGETQVAHPEGKIKVKIPKGTQIGDMVKISGKGFGAGGIFSKRGDMYLISHVNIPKKLSKSEEKLWEELKKGGK